MGDSSSSSSSSSPSSYIRMVHHLIEKCLVLNLTQEECVDSLFKYANIKPIITTTVWKELEKENRGFFQAYTKERENRVVEMDTMERVQKLLLEISSKDNDD